MIAMISIIFRVLAEEDALYIVRLFAASGFHIIRSGYMPTPKSVKRAAIVAQDERKALKSRP